MSFSKKDSAYLQFFSYINSLSADHWNCRTEHKRKRLRLLVLMRSFRCKCRALENNPATCQQVVNKHSHSFRKRNRTYNIR